MYGMERRGISRADIEYALCDASTEYSVGEDAVLIAATLPDGRNIKVRALKKPEKPTLIVAAYVPK